MIKLTDEERNSYIMWATLDDVRGNWPAECLALAFRRAVAEIRRLEFWSQHCPWKGGCSTNKIIDGVIQECTDPRHDYDQAAWEREADKYIREGR